MEQSPSWAANKSSAKKFPAFYGTRRFITAFTASPTYRYSEPDQSCPTLHPTFWLSIIPLSSHLRLGLPSGVFPSGFPTKTLHAHLLSPMHATCPHLILFYLITRLIPGKGYRSQSSSLCSLLYSPVTSSRLCPNIFLSTLISNTLILCSSLKLIYLLFTPIQNRQNYFCLLLWLSISFSV